MTRGVFVFFGSNFLSRLKIVTWMGIVVFFKNQAPLIVKMYHYSVYHNEKNMLMIGLCMLLTYIIYPDFKDSKI